MNSPKSIYIQALDRAGCGYNLLADLKTDKVSLALVREARSYLSDACLKLNQLERILRNIPEPEVGEAREDK